MDWLSYVFTLWIAGGLLGLGVLAYERLTVMIRESKGSPELLRRQIARMHRTEQALRAIEFEGVE